MFKKLFYIFLLFICASSLFATEDVKIGVLALRGKELALSQWQPTIDALNSALPEYRFILKPLTFDEIEPEVKNKSIDFLLANSSIYVDMEKKYQLSAMVTMRSKLDNAKASPIFGGVIFTTAYNVNINSLDDLDGKKFAAVDKTSFGGWRMAYKTLIDNDINPETDFAALTFAKTHDNVVYNVLSGKADAGTVRSGVLEAMASEGKISLSGIKVLHRTYCAGLDLLTSTECYPEWPIAKLPHVQDVLANSLATYLIKMPSNDKANVIAQIDGWSVAYSYESVDALLKALKLPPYDKEISFFAFIDAYWYLFVIIFIGFAAVSGVLVYISKLNHTLKIKSTELQYNFNKLQVMQKQLIESEKMASLGSLVAGVSHEINTPVGMGVTGITYILEKTKDIKSMYEQGQMGEEDFNEYLNKTLEVARSVEINLNRAAQLVRSFKQVAIDQSTEEKREFYVRAYVDEVLLSLRNKLKKTNIKIDIEIDDMLKITSYPSAFSQILTNFIMNSLIHAFADGDENGVIKIVFKEDVNDFTLIYSDNGKGIDEASLQRVFEPFFTTARGVGGSGLGLHIVYNIVTQMLGGTIMCTSSLGHGATFKIKIPNISKRDKI